MPLFNPSEPLAIDPLRFGASVDPAVDSAAAIRDALTVHRATPGSRVLLTLIYGIASAIVIQAGDIIEGIGREASGFQVIGGGSHHGLYGPPFNPAHGAELKNFSVWGKSEVVGTGAFDCIRIHDARGLIITNVGGWDGDALCIRLIDCDQARAYNPVGGSFTEARYLANPAWPFQFDGCAHSKVFGGYGFRTGQGFAITGDDSYKRTYAWVSSTANDEITCIDPVFFTNLAAGDELRVFLMDGVGTMPGGLTEHTVYYAIKTGTDSTRVIKLAATYADAIAGTPVVNITSAGSGTARLSSNNIALFQIDKHPKSTSATADAATDGFTVDATLYQDHTVGYPIYFTTAGTLPTGLSLNTVYYSYRAGSSVVKPASSFANAVAGTPVNFTDVGSGATDHTVRLAKVSTFTRSGNEIILAPALYEILRTGDPVFFMAEGGTPPTGLTALTIYYVIHLSTYGNISLATTAANARAGTAIALSSAGSGTQMCVFHSSFGANQTDSLTRRPYSANRGNRMIVCVVERHDSHAFNINSGLDCGGIGCVASDLEEYATPMGGGTLVDRVSFQIKHSKGPGADRNFFESCHAIRCGTGFGAQEAEHGAFINCTVDEAEYAGFLTNSSPDFQIINPKVNSAKVRAFWILSGSTRVQIHNFAVKAHPNGISTLFDLDSSGHVIIGAGRHSGTFAFVLDIDAGSGSFDILPGFKTLGLPISIVPTTGRYPINYVSSEIDLSVTGVRCIAPNVVGIQVARVTKVCTVATTGSPTLAVGRRDSTGALSAATAPPATLDLSAIVMSPADATWALAASKTLAVEVVVAGTGKTMVEFGCIEAN